MKYLIIAACLICFSKAGAQQKGKDISFDFVLMSDIHIKPEVTGAFQQVIDTVNKMDIDFIMTAGDLVFDVMRGNPRHADSLFNLYKSMSSRFKKPVYNCIGNHELFGIYPESDVDSTHPGYKYGMYQKYLGKTYYSFDHKGWHFIVLNSIDVNSQKKYYGVIDAEQREWLKKDLARLDSLTPVAVVTHIPFLSVYDQRYKEKQPVPDPNGVIISNRKEILDLLQPYNLKLVMQGHIHWIEEIFINNKTHFITAGAVAGRPSWQGNVNGKRGFMKISVKGEKISWEYITYEK
jgi:Icc protein